MGGIISVCGDKRFMTPNAVWMAHDAKGFIYDYFDKMECRMEYYKVLKKQINDIFSKHTKLSVKELRRATTGELWYNPTQCKEKGIIDAILERK